MLMHGVIRYPQGLPIVRMDSRVKHGNDREWRGVMPDLIRHPWGFQDKTGFPCKTCEIDAQISRVKPGDDNREGCR